MNPSNITWTFSRFHELSTTDLYEIIKARIEVFAVEQNCPYQDLDGVDQTSHHLTGWDDKHEVAAYTRIVAPGKKYQEPSIGRVITTKTWRGTGLGKELMRRSLQETRKLWPNCAIRISAQHYLEKFYQSFGFRTASAPYDEDGIPHIEMTWENS